MMVGDSFVLLSTMLMVEDSFVDGADDEWSLASALSQRPVSILVSTLCQTFRAQLCEVGEVNC